MSLQSTSEAVPLLVQLVEARAEAPAYSRTVSGTTRSEQYSSRDLVQAGV